LGLYWGLPGIALAALAASVVSLTMQAKCVLRFFGLKLADGCLMGAAAKLVALGCLPVIFGSIVLRAWVPQSWPQIGLFGIFYLVVGAFLFLRLDPQLRAMIGTVPFHLGARALASTGIS
jgi:hypothetical protein